MKTDLISRRNFLRNTALTTTMALISPLGFMSNKTMGLYPNDIKISIE